MPFLCPEPAPAGSDHASAVSMLKAHGSTPRTADELRPYRIPAPGEAAGLARSPLPDSRQARRVRRLRPSRVPARASAAPAQQVRDVLRVSGQPLTAPLKAEMEARLGADLSDVRLHAGAAASASAAAVGARAYASGSHVVVGDGGADKRTLAHELTHVLQQRQGSVAGTDYGTGLAVSDPAGRFEREAEAGAARAMAGLAPKQPPEQVQPKAPPATTQVTPVQRAIRVVEKKYGADSSGDSTSATRDFSRTLRLKMKAHGYEETQADQSLWQEAGKAIRSDPGWEADSWANLLSQLENGRLIRKVLPSSGIRDREASAVSADAVTDAFAAGTAVVVAGEKHGELDPHKEKAIWQAAGIKVSREHELLPIAGRDILQIRLDAPLMTLVAIANDACGTLTNENVAEWAKDPDKNNRDELVKELAMLREAGEKLVGYLHDELTTAGIDPRTSSKFRQAELIYEYLDAIVNSLAFYNQKGGLPGPEASAGVLPYVNELASESRRAIPMESPALAQLADDPKKARSASMLARLTDWGANVAPPAIWKVGESHINDIRTMVQDINFPVPKVRLMGREEYLKALHRETRFQGTRAYFAKMPIEPAIEYLEYLEDIDDEGIEDIE
jgi:hypothetical protein